MVIMVKAVNDAIVLGDWYINKIDVIVNEINENVENLVLVIINKEHHLI